MAEARAKLEAGKSDPDLVRAGMYFEVIQSDLAGVPLRIIMEACGIAKSTASAIRAGRCTPTRRHWSTLAELGR
jgi:hypothetical protein